MSVYTWILVAATILNAYVNGGDVSCSNGAEKCIAPQFKDYVSKDPMAPITKFLTDSLKVPCEKLDKAFKCLKKDYPSCSYASTIAGPGPLPAQLEGPNYAPGGPADKGIDMLRNYVCVEEFSVYNEAKNCLIMNMMQIQSEITSRNCKLPTGTSPSEMEKIQKQMCSNFDATPFKCIFDSISKVCGAAFIAKTKTLFKRLCDLDSSSNLAGNLAFGKSTSQSSTWDSDSGSSKAVDGNADSNFYTGKSCMHTLYEANAWWAVDLGCDATVESVTITNRGDNQLGSRLHDFNVGISDVDPKVTPPRPDNYAVCADYKGNAGDGAKLALKCKSGSNAGRYVIVQMPSAKVRNYLHICEVAVTGVCKTTENLALKKKTFQSSTYVTGDSSKAVDGNANPNYSGASCTHTNNDVNAWWAVDLGCTARIDRVTITNRGDNGYGYRLNNFNVAITSTDPNVTRPVPSNYKICATYKGAVGDGATLSFACKNLTATGRYVVIQMPGQTQNMLSLCEVVVNGNCASSKKNSAFDFLKRAALSLIR